ncbi:ADP-ribosyltransferase domain-containing protein, partial [Pseudoalteromonas sp. A2]
LDKPFSGNTKIMITSKSGVNIANNAAVKPDEEEVLFKSGTKFKVISRIKVNGTNFIELEEV